VHYIANALNEAINNVADYAIFQLLLSAKDKFNPASGNLVQKTPKGKEIGSPPGHSSNRSMQASLR